MKGKQCLAGILAAVLLATTFVGCSKGNSSSETGLDKAIADESGRKIVGNVYVSGLPVLKTKTTYTIAISFDTNSTISMAEKAASIEAEKQTNIHIEWQQIPSTGWTEKVNIMIAGGDLPDAFASQVDVMANKDAFAKLNNIIEQYAPNIKDMFTAQPLLKKAVTSPDGNIITLPTNRADKSSVVNDGLWINKKWLDKLGLSMPTTTDEFANVLKAFKTRDPNGNSMADEIAFGVLQIPGSSSIDVMFGPFGVVDTSDYVYVKSNKVIFPGIQAEYFEGLKWLHQLYADGLMEQELFTMTSAQFTAKCQNKDVLYGAIMNWLPDAMDARYGDDYVLVPPLKGPSGNQLWTKLREPNGNLAGFSITTKCKDPAALVRYYDNNISSLANLMLWFNGPEGSGIWKPMPDGKWMETMEFKPAAVASLAYKRTVAVGPSSVAYLVTKFNDLRVNEPRIEKRIAANDILLKYAVEMLPVGLDDPARASQRTLLFVDIDNYMKKFKANSIVQGITDAQWQTHLLTTKQLKVDEYASLWQQYLDSKK